MANIDDVKSYLKALQNRICAELETLDGKARFLHNLPGLAAERVLAVGFGKHEKLDLPRFDRACLAAGVGLCDLGGNTGVVRSQLALHEEALRAACESLRLAPDNPVVLANLGATLSELGRLEESARAARRAEEVVVQVEALVEVQAADQG